MKTISIIHHKRRVVDSVCALAKEGSYCNSDSANVQE